MFKSSTPQEKTAPTPKRLGLKVVRKNQLAKLIKEELLDIQSHFPEMKFEQLKVSIEITEGYAGDCDVELRRIDGGVKISITWNPVNRLNEFCKGNIAAFFFWFVSTDSSVEYITFHSLDGQSTSCAKYASSGFRENVIPLPDPYFFKTRGFQDVSEYVVNHNVNWNARSDKIVWRGGVNGIGYRSFDKEMVGNPQLCQRITMANLVKDTDTDFKFVIRRLSPSHEEFIKSRGYIGEKIEEMTWINHKYAIDIDGFTNTWSNLLIRMKLGCCVFKVASQFGLQQWYYDKLKPFEHYIPVAADLSDWFEKVEWAKTHLKECAEIARAGQVFANSMDFQSETKFAVQRIEETWNT